MEEGNSLGFTINQTEFERQGSLDRLVKAAVTNPLANYLPSGLLRGLLKFGKSELAAANWVNPGGWRSMVISYNGRPNKPADKILVAGGLMPKALRNRRRLGASILAQLIDASGQEPVHVLCLGAGPGHIIMDAMLRAKRKSHSTLVDINSDAFEYGRELARQSGLADRVRFVHSDIRGELEHLLADPPHVVKMIGICEYLTDEQIVEIGSAVSGVMPPGSAIVFNSISRAYGTDRFFRRVFGLHMNHRSPEELQRLFGAAGLGDFVTIPEPLGVYHVIVGHKKA